MYQKMLFMLLWVCTFAASGSELVFTESGHPVPGAAVRLLPGASAIEEEGARELVSEFAKISGATLPVVRGAVSAGARAPEIVFATLRNGGALIPAEVRKKLSAAASTQGFYLTTRGNRLLIVGKNPIGAFYGAMTLLTQYCGARYFHAGPEGTHRPHRPRLAFGALDDFQTPAIERRMFGVWRGSVAPWSVADYRQWCRRNRMHYDHRATENQDAKALCGDEKITQGGHLTFEQAVPQSFFKSHPEYFPLQNGKRVCKERSQRCLSNPEVFKLVVDYGVACGRRGELLGVNFHDSTDGWCACENCRRYGTFNGKYSLSNLAHRFASEASAEILRQVPGARGGRSLIYSDFRDEVSNPDLRYSDGVKVLYCSHQRCYVHALDAADVPCNRRFYRELLGWRKHAPNLGIYDYYSYANAPYCPLEYTFASDIRLYRKLGLRSFYDDCTNKDLPMPWSNWQFYYVGARMLWNPGLDVEKLLDETYDLYYGAAAAPMKRYHALRRELWESAPGHALYGGGKRYAACLVADGAEKRLLGLLDSALRSASSDPVVAKRIAADRAFLTKFWIAEAAKLKKNFSGRTDIASVRASSPIRIDGVLDEDVWRKAPLNSNFRVSGGGEPAEETRVKVAYDGKNFYFGIEAMMEHTWGGKLKADVKTADGPVFSTIRSKSFWPRRIAIICIWW